MLVVLKQILFAIEIVLELLYLLEQLAFSSLLVDHLFAFDLRRNQCLGVDRITLTFHELDSFDQDVVFVLELLHNERNLAGSIVGELTTSLAGLLLLPCGRRLSARAVGHLACGHVLLLNRFLVDTVDYLLDHLLIDSVGLLQVIDLLREVLVLPFEVGDFQEELLRLAGVVRRRVIAGQAGREHVANGLIRRVARTRYLLLIFFRVSLFVFFF